MVWDLRDTMMAMSLEPGAMRRQRLLETRKLAVNIEKHKQQEYRDAVVLSVEKEVAIRRAKWEDDKAHQLLALQRLYAQSLAMIGSGQKAAAQELVADSVGAQEHKQAWEQLSRTALIRGEEARQQVLHIQSQYSPVPLAVDTALYRHEVQRQAAMAERWQARRASMAATEARAQAQDSDAGKDASRSTSAARRSSSKGSRASVYYGPHAGDPPVPVRDEKGRRGVFKQPRVPAVGTLEAGGVSTVRVPVVVAPGHACDPSVSPGGPSAHERAEEEARLLQAAREEAGRATLAAQAEQERQAQVAVDAAAGLRALEALTQQQQEVDERDGLGGGRELPMDVTQDMEEEEGEGDTISLPDVTGAWLSWQQAGRAKSAGQDAREVDTQEDAEATPAPLPVPRAAQPTHASSTVLGSVGMRTVGGSWAVLGQGATQAEGMGSTTGKTGGYSLAHALQAEAEGGEDAQHDELDGPEADPYYRSYYGLGIEIGHRTGTGRMQLEEQQLPEEDE